MNQEIEKKAQQKIETATPEQLAEVDRAAERWIAVGYSTEACDRERVERHLGEHYRAMLDLEPVPVEWYLSPDAAMAARPDRASEIVAALNIAPGWYTWTIHCVEVCRIFEIEHSVPQSTIDSFVGLMESVGAAAAFERVCIAIDRPEVLKTDNEGNLHCQDGPAIRYRDGASVYCWHGTKIPADWIEKTAEVDIRLALTWENIEERRCLAEIIGWARVLEQLSPTVVDVGPTPEIGTLLRVDLPDSPGEQFLRVRCGTGRDFVIPVSKDARRAIDANAETYGLTAEEYGELEFRT